MAADRQARSAAYPSICSAHQERVEGCPLCYPEPTAASVYHSWRARLVRIRVYMAKRDPYPEEEWAWEK